MGLIEEFQADQETRQQSQQFQLEQDFRSYLKDQAAGGSVRQAPVPANPPIGAVVGGITGTLASGGNPAVGMVGAAGGEAVQQLAERAMGDPNAPRSTAEAAIRLGRETLTQGIFDLGFLIPKVQGLAPFAKSVTPEAKEAMAFVKAHGGPEQSLLPAEMTSNRFLDILQNISEHSLLGGGAIQVFKQDRDLFNTQLAHSIVGRYGPAMDADAVGRAVADSASRNLEAAKFPAKFIYEAIESAAAPQYAKAPKTVTVTKTTAPITKESVAKMNVKRTEGDAAEEGADPSLLGLKVKTSYQQIQVGEQLQRMKVMVTEQETQIGGARIDLRPLKDELAGMSRTAEEGGGLVDTAMGNTLLAFINKKPDLVSYPVAKAMRTEVRAYRDQLMGSPETKNAPGIGKAKSIYEKLTTQIRAGLADDDPFLATMWDEANLIEAGANQQFNTKMIRELVKMADVRGQNAPEAIVDKVWRAGRPTQVKVVRNALDPPAWQKMQQIELQKLMDDSFVNGVPNGKRMEAALFGKGGIGEDVLTAGFDATTTQELKDFTKTLLLQESKAPDGTGRIWIQLAQATAAVQAVGAGMAAIGVTSEEYGGKGMTAAGTAIVFGPAVVSNLMVRPGAIKWLTEAISTSPGTKKWIMATTQLGKILQGTIPRPAAAPTPSTQLPTMENKP